MLCFDDDGVARGASGSVDDCIVVATAFWAFHGGLLAVCWVAPPETGEHCLSRVEPALGALSGPIPEGERETLAVFPAVMVRAKPCEVSPGWSLVIRS